MLSPALEKLLTELRGEMRTITLGLETLARRVPAPPAALTLLSAPPCEEDREKLRAALNAFVADGRLVTGELVSDRCSHNTPGGEEFCVLCLRARADAAELERDMLRVVAEHASEVFLQEELGLNFIAKTEAKHRTTEQLRAWRRRFPKTVQK